MLDEYLKGGALAAVLDQKCDRDVELPYRFIY
jgi:hypothetical protein